MIFSSARVLDRLPAEEKCLGALFTSYSFDPVFFEEHVLRAVLRLVSDPVEQPERYHQEARRALQETPVVAIVDAGEWRPGRRLPYDILQVSNPVFHPKSILLLYRGFARLLIGSGNLTFSGYSGNTELFHCIELSFDKAPDMSLLFEFEEFLCGINSLVRTPGTQLALFRQELQRKLSPELSGGGTASLKVLQSVKKPILEQFIDLLPEGAEIETIGMLAPFYERDDGGELEASSVFGALASRASEKVILEVGVIWDNPQVSPCGNSDLQNGLGRIWTWSRENDGQPSLEHLVPVSLGPNTLSFLDETGQKRRRPIEEIRVAINKGALWMQPPPIVFAPQKTLMAARDSFTKVQFWLHPATRLVEGRPVHRPLHAKLLKIGYRCGTSRKTLVLAGSPNISRKALLMIPERGNGNVELAVAFCLDFHLSLRDLVPELVQVPESAIEPKERTFPDGGKNYALAIKEVRHDPKCSKLLVSWAEESSDLPPWSLSYDGQQFAAESIPPSKPVTVEGFTLKPSTAEVILHVGGAEYPVPILVTDLVALPVVPAGSNLELEELLFLLGHRLGTERAIQIASGGGADSCDTDRIRSSFWESFNSSDVFRAWWAIAEDLKNPALSIQAFRLLLEGALGVGAAWNCMLKAPEQGTIPAENVWFYGAELIRTLDRIELPFTDDREDKKRQISAFCTQVRIDLKKVRFKTGSPDWFGHLRAFYGEEKA